jgi:predicted RNA-binding protein with PUA-like domain
MSRRWLFKTEPSEYSFEDLVRDGRAAWDGVTNALALKHLRSARKGDAVIVYHTGKVRAAVGLAKIARDPYPDPNAKSPGLVVVDLVPDKKLARGVELGAMRKNPAIAGLDLLRIPRLSVVPVSEAHWKAIMEMAR